MRVIAIIQARMGSTRLPGKVLSPILDRPMLWHIVQRVSAVRGIASVMVATSNCSTDDAVIEFCEALYDPSRHFLMQDVLDLLATHPQVSQRN